MRHRIRSSLMALLLCLFVLGRASLGYALAAQQSSEELLKQQKQLQEEAKKLEEQKKAAEREKNAAQSGLSEANESIQEFTSEKEVVGEAIDDLTDDLVSLMANIAMIEEEIEDTRNRIDETQAAYEDARAKEEEQYQAMKARAKFMYERGDTDMFLILIQSDSVSDFLNRALYVKELYDYDRRELDTFIQTKDEARELGERLEEQKAELEADHYELELSQADMETILSELRAQSENYDVLLAHAKQDAAAYQVKIKQQSKAIDRLADELSAKAAEQERVKKAAEEAKAREEAEAKAKAEAEARAKAEAERAAKEKAEREEAEREESQEQEKEEESEKKESSSNSKKSYSAPGSSTGSNVASYACQFVGNPYVPGGTSLTDGCDCSGFTQSVYKAFGVSIPRTSWSQQKVGKEVSLENARAGDIVCYAGHVAIYLGDGRIVHASTQRSGIKYGNVNYKSIITIRRLV